MSILSGTGRIYMVREQVCGRFGMHRLLAMISSNSLGVKWNGINEITVVTFNKRKTICKILKYEISYLSILAIDLLLLKVIIVISSSPSQLTFKELAASLACRRGIPNRPEIGSFIRTIRPVEDRKDMISSP